MVYLALSRIGDLSIEHALRRAGLVAQLRFAVTLQDIRTVVLLRRQLSQENPRLRPWIRIGRAKRRSLVPPIWRRDWQSYLRFPAAPPASAWCLLGVVAGLSLGLMWRGATPMFIVAGLALYLAAYDAVEPIAQEVDHPTRWESYPDQPGRLVLQHLPAAFVYGAGVPHRRGLGPRPRARRGRLAAVPRARSCPSPWPRPSSRHDQHGAWARPTWPG